MNETEQYKILYSVSFICKTREVLHFGGENRTEWKGTGECRRIGAGRRAGGAGGGVEGAGSGILKVAEAGKTGGNYAMLQNILPLKKMQS